MGIISILISLLILSSFVPQFGSPNTPFHISPFHSFQSTFTFIHISLFYYILLSSLHSYSILLNTITGISFSSFITHIIHFLFPFISTLSYHINSIHISSSINITIVTSICYYFINSSQFSSILIFLDMIVVDCSINHLILFFTFCFILHSTLIYSYPFLLYSMFI